MYYITLIKFGFSIYFAVWPGLHFLHKEKNYFSIQLQKFLYSIFCTYVNLSLYDKYMWYYQSCKITGLLFSSSYIVKPFEPVHEKNNNLHRRKQSRRSASRLLTSKLISTFVFATRIVQSLSYLNTKFPASNHLL